MTNAKTRYDENEHTLWVYYQFEKPMTLVPGGELQAWVKQRQQGQTSDGQPLKWVNIVFADEKSAAYNHQPLTFSKLGVYFGDLSAPTQYRSPDGDPSFDTRSDFGID